MIAQVDVRELAASAPARCARRASSGLGAALPAVWAGCAAVAQS
jgi:hypothetical protein